jgi:hypothetical protein
VVLNLKNKIMKKYFVTENLELKKYTPYKLYITIVLLLLTNGLSIYYFNQKQSTMPKLSVLSYHRDTIVNTEYLDIPLTKENVYNEIIANGIVFPDVVFEQCLLESKHLKSDIAIENNNLFGLRVYPNADTTYAIARNRGHLVFKHWTESVKEYARYQRRNFLDKKDVYYKFLKSSGYAEAENYINTLKGINITLND